MGTFLFVIGIMLTIVLLIVINLCSFTHSVLNDKTISKVTIIIDILVILGFIAGGLILGIN